MSIDSKELLVGHYMTAYPISVKPSVPFKTVINFMASKGIATLVVMEPEKTMPLGVLTEREILHYVVSEGKIPDKSVQDLQIQSFMPVTPDTSIVDAARIMISKKSRLLVFADGNKLVGIITASDMLRAFRKTKEAPALDKVWSSTVYQSKYDDSILSAARILHEKKIGSVIVSRDSSYGIFTQRDLVKILEREGDLNGRVGENSSFPLVTARKGIKANEAASVMAANNIKRLVLTDNGGLASVVTARDIVDAFQMESKR